MIIQIDSREQKNRHITDYFDNAGVKYVISKMICGDYQRLDYGLLCIDKKFGLAEVYSCVVGGYDRFARECKTAKDCGITLVILTENEYITDITDVHTWQNPRQAEYDKLIEAKRKGQKLKKAIPPAPPISSDRIEARMRTFSKRYGVQWQFCRKADTAKRILEILGYES